jgi:hypothetical protein
MSPFPLTSKEDHFKHHTHLSSVNMSNRFHNPPPPGLNGADEEQPLLPKPHRQSILAKCRKSLTAEVTRDWADLVLLLCYVVTGLLDSASTNAWGAFVSMQTGQFTCPSALMPLSTRN